MHGSDRLVDGGIMSQEGEFESMLSRCRPPHLRSLLFCSNTGPVKEVRFGSFEFQYWILYGDLEKRCIA